MADTNLVEPVHVAVHRFPITAPTEATASVPSRTTGAEADAFHHVTNLRGGAVPPLRVGKTGEVRERELRPGSYESLITVRLARALARIDQRTIGQAGVHAAELPDRVSLHVARLIERVIGGIAEPKRAAASLRGIDQLLAALEQLDDGVDLGDERVDTGPSVLRAVTTLRPDGSTEPIDLPLIPLLDTTLLTNAPGEPRVGQQIVTEIGSADRIDVLMAFIRVTGINPLLNALRNTAKPVASYGCSPRRTPARPNRSPSNDYATSAPR